MAPSSSHSPSPLKKLLITDQKPRSKPNNCTPTAAHPNSATGVRVSDTSAEPSEKRTRDQPNLSDCHSCSRRVNDTDPKDRLQLMDSIWRIVLLCRKCRKDVRSGKTCSYCLQGTGNSGDIFQCTLCERKIHKDCVYSHGASVPWCYFGVRQDSFKICVDCWVPELLKSSYRVRCRNVNKGVALEDKVVAKNVSKKAIKETKCEVKKVGRNDKVKSSTMGKRGRHVLDLTNVVLALEAINYKDKDGAENLGSTEVHDVDNPEFAVKSSSSDVLDAGARFGLTYVRSGLGKSKLGGCRSINQPGEVSSCNDVKEVTLGLLPYTRGKKRKVWLPNDENVEISESQSRHPVKVETNSLSDDGTIRGLTKGTTDISEASLEANNDQNFVCYKRTRLKEKVCQIKDPVCIGECRSKDGDSMAFEPGAVKLEDVVSPSVTKVFFPYGGCHREGNVYHMEHDGGVTVAHLDSTFPHYTEPGRGNQGGCNEVCKESSSFPPGTRNGDPDHYRLKYIKRKKSSKSGSGTNFFNETVAAVPVLAMNDSVESKTFTDISFDSSDHQSSKGNR